MITIDNESRRGRLASRCQGGVLHLKRKRGVPMGPWKTDAPVKAGAFVFLLPNPPHPAHRRSPTT